MFDNKATRIAGVVAAMVTLVAVSACGSKEAQADNDIFGLATRHGVCAKPQLAEQLQVPTTEALQMVPPFADFQGDNSGMVAARFTGVALIALDDTLVEIDDITQLTPCAADDRTQCATEVGVVFFADGTTAGVTPNQQFEVHAPWRFRNIAETWATVDGRAAEVDAAIAHCGH